MPPLRLGATVYRLAVTVSVVRRFMKAARAVSLTLSGVYHVNLLGRKFETELEPTPYPSYIVLVNLLVVLFIIFILGKIENIVECFYTYRHKSKHPYLPITEGL